MGGDLLEKRDKTIVAALGAALPTVVMAINLINLGFKDGGMLAWFYLIPVIVVVYPLSVFLAVKLPASHPYEVLLTSVTLPGLILVISAGLQLPR